MMIFFKAAGALALALGMLLPALPLATCNGEALRITDMKGSNFAFYSNEVRANIEDIKFYE